MTGSEIKLAVVVVLFTLLAVLERQFAAAVRPERDARGRVARNLLLGALNAALGPLLLVALTATFAQHALGWRAPFANPVLEFLFGFVVLDVWAYGLHRAYHEVPLMWRLHSVHHRDTFLDVTSAVRFHPGEVLVSTLLRSLPIMLLALPLTTVAAYEILLLASALFHHSNVAMPARVEALVRHVLVTPSHHWVHHHANARDTQRNYASFLTVWDWLFGTWSPTQRTAHMPVGIPGLADASVPGLLAQPFRALRTVA